MPGIVEGMLQSGAPGMKFEKPGDLIVGVLVEIDEVQGTDYTTDLPLWWAGGGKITTVEKPGQQPYMVPIFTVDAEKIITDGVQWSGKSEEDDGQRSIWARQNIFTALRDAFKKAFPGQKKIPDARLIGGIVRLKFVKNGEAKPKMNPPKLFSAEFEPRAIAVSSDSIGEPEYDEANPPPPTEGW